MKKKKPHCDIQCIINMIRKYAPLRVVTKQRDFFVPFSLSMMPQIVSLFIHIHGTGSGTVYGFIRITERKFLHSWTVRRLGVELRNEKYRRLLELCTI